MREMVFTQTQDISLLLSENIAERETGNNAGIEGTQDIWRVIRPFKAEFGLILNNTEVVEEHSRQRDVVGGCVGWNQHWEITRI